MPNVLTSLEIDLRWLGAIAGLGTLFYAIFRMLHAQSRPAGHHTGSAQQVLRTRYMIIATVIFLILAYVLWKPLPIQINWLLQLGISLLGVMIFFPGLGLYLWGLHTLGESFNASSGFGVRLQQAHQLVTTGPYAYLRHPMYMGVMLSAWGGLLLYRTWTMLLFAIIMFGLIIRARREEVALSQVFGRQYELYKRNIPGWFPRLDKLLPGLTNKRMH
jgi:protein-S-isoprenylcysteine O-methyltransferase Ste14